jgi:adenylate kinase
MSRQVPLERVVLGLMGPPGAGKGTQANKIVRGFGFAHLSTGDILRREIREETGLGRQAAAIINHGDLLPDELMNPVARRHIEIALRKNGRALLDGYPRTVNQCEYLNALFQKWGHINWRMFFLDVPAEVVVERLAGRRVCASCGALYHIQSQQPHKRDICDACGGPVVCRIDDTPPSIRLRIQEYERLTVPVLDTLEQQGALVRIPASEEHEQVYAYIAPLIRKILVESGAVLQD